MPPRRVVAHRHHSVPQVDAIFMHSRRLTSLLVRQASMPTKRNLFRSYSGILSLLLSHDYLLEISILSHLTRDKE